MLILSNLSLLLFYLYFPTLSHALPSEEVHKKPGREYSQEVCWKLTKGVLQTRECHAQWINMGGGLSPKSEADLGSGRGVWHHSVGAEQLHYASHVFSIIIIIVTNFIINHYYYILLHFQLLNSSYGNI